MPASKDTVMVLLNRVRTALDKPDLDLVDNDTDIMMMMLTYGVYFKYITTAEMLGIDTTLILGGQPDGTIYVITDGRLPMKWSRARHLCFAILRRLGLSLSEQVGK